MCDDVIVPQLYGMLLERREADSRVTAVLSRPEEANLLRFARRVAQRVDDNCGRITYGRRDYSMAPTRTVLG